MSQCTGKKWSLWAELVNASTVLKISLSDGGLISQNIGSWENLSVKSCGIYIFLQNFIVKNTCKRLIIVELENFVTFFGYYFPNSLSYVTLLAQFLEDRKSVKVIFINEHLTTSHF